MLWYHDVRSSWFLVRPHWGQSACSLFCFKRAPPRFGVIVERNGVQECVIAHRRAAGTVRSFKKLIERRSLRMLAGSQCDRRSLPDRPDVMECTQWRVRKAVSRMISSDAS